MSDGAGLVVLIKPNGSKLWRYRYSRDSRKQKLSLGSYPELSLAQARVKAADARAKLAQGISPVDERREKREASKVVNSFEGVCLEWQANYTSTHPNDTTGNGAQSLVTTLTATTYVAPILFCRTSSVTAYRLNADWQR